MATGRKKAKTTKSRKSMTKKRAAYRRKTTVSYKKKAAPRKKAYRTRAKTTKRTAKKYTKRFGTVRYVSKSRGKFKYVIYDGGGKDHYGTNSLRKARAMVAVLKEKHPRAKFTIYEIARGK